MLRVCEAEPHKKRLQHTGLLHFVAAQGIWKQEMHWHYVAIRYLRCGVRRSDAGHWAGLRRPSWQINHLGISRGASAGRVLDGGSRLLANGQCITTHNNSLPGALDRIVFKKDWGSTPIPARRRSTWNRRFPREKRTDLHVRGATRNFQRGRTRPWKHHSDLPMPPPRRAHSAPGCN